MHQHSAASSAPDGAPGSGLRRLWGGVIVGLGAVVLLTAREPLLTAIGGFLIVRDDLRPADVIHVIAGDDYRTGYAIQLYQQGYGKKLFFTGGWCEFHQYDHAEHGEVLAAEQGLPPSALAGDVASVTSTWDEAVRLKAFMDGSPTPIRSVIVVSDPWHMQRARWTYRQVLGDRITVLMAPVPMQQTPYVQRWWTDPASTQYVKDEYVKMLYYLARYRWSWGPLKTWLASLDKA